MTYVERQHAKVARLCRRFVCIQAAQGTLYCAMTVFGQVTRTNWRTAILMNLADHNPSDAEINETILWAMGPTLMERAGGRIKRIGAYFSEAFSDYWASR